MAAGCHWGGSGSNNITGNSRYFLLQIAAMLRSPKANSPSIDHLFSMVAVGSAPRRQQAEREQIELIRSMGRDMFGEEDVEASGEREGRDERTERAEGGKTGRVKVHERGMEDKKRKMERIMLNKTAETARTEKRYGQTGKQAASNKTVYAVESKYKNNPKKEERLVKEVVKKRIDEQQVKIAENIGKIQKEKASNAKTARKIETQKKLNNGQHSQRNFGFAYAQLNRKATKEEVDLAFEEVVRKSEDILKRKQRKILQAKEQMFGKQMQGVTFIPHLASCERLRKCDTRNFLERLDQDHINRDVQKTNILKEELSRDPFRPKLNDHVNTHSASKISSFRNDQIHLYASISSTHLLQRQLSRLTESQQSFEPMSSQLMSFRMESSNDAAVVDQRDLDFLLT